MCNRCKYIPEKMTMAVRRAYSALSTFMLLICLPNLKRGSAVSPTPAILYESRVYGRLLAKTMLSVLASYLRAQRSIITSLEQA